MSISLRIHITKDILQKSMFCGHADKMILHPNATDKSQSENCAIAWAIKDVFPTATVGRYSIFLEDFSTEIILPEKAEDFIDEFDGSTPEEISKMKEFSFEIEVPDEIIDTIDINQIHQCATLELV